MAMVPNQGSSRIPAFSSIQTDDPDLKTVQDNIGTAVERLSRCPIADGLLLRNIVLTSGGGGTVIDHKMGRPYQGWLVVGVRDVDDPTVFLLIREGPSDSSLAVPSRSLLLVTNQASVTVDLWIF